MSRTLVLLHGALGSRYQLLPLKGVLGADLEVLTLDFEGHGERPSERAFSIDLFTENLLELVQAKGLAQVDLFGYSMGGYVALDFAGKHPERVGKVVTLGTKMAWTEAFAAQETQMLDPDRMEAKVPKFAQHLQDAHPANDWKEVVRKTAAMMSALGAGRRLEEADFARIPQEVCLIVGERDRMVGREETEHVARLLPHGRVQVLEDAPHPLEQVELQKLADVIKGVLA